MMEKVAPIQFTEGAPDWYNPWAKDYIADPLYPPALQMKNYFVNWEQNTALLMELSSLFMMTIVVMIKMTKMVKMMTTKMVKMMAVMLMMESTVLC